MVSTVDCGSISSGSNPGAGTRVLLVKKINSITGDHLEYFKVVVPGISEQGFYRQTTSWSAFFMNGNKRNHKGDIWFIARRLWDPAGTPKII